MKYYYLEYEGYVLASNAQCFVKPNNDRLGSLQNIYKTYYIITKENMIEKRKKRLANGYTELATQAKEQGNEECYQRYTEMSEMIKKSEVKVLDVNL